MQINTVQYNNNLTSGARVKNTQTMKLVFQYNKELLKSGNTEEVAKFCDALTNIYRKSPKSDYFCCKGAIYSPSEFDDNKDMLSLNLFLGESRKQDWYTLGYKILPEHNNGERNLLKEAQRKIAEMATEKIIIRGKEVQSPLFKFVDALVGFWNNITFKNKEKILLEKLDNLESKMVNMYY